MVHAMKNAARGVCISSKYTHDTASAASVRAMTHNDNNNNAHTV